MNTYQNGTKHHMKTHQRENKIESDFSVIFIGFLIRMLFFYNFVTLTMHIWGYLPVFMGGGSLSAKGNQIKQKRAHMSSAKLIARKNATHEHILYQKGAKIT